MEGATAVVDAPVTAVDSAPSNPAPVAESTPVDSGAPVTIPNEDQAFDSWFQSFRDKKDESAQAPAGEVAQSIEQAEKDAAAWLEQQSQQAAAGGETPAPAAEAQPAPPAQAPTAAPSGLNFDAILPPLTPEQYEQLAYNPEAQRARETQVMQANAQMFENMMLTHFMPMMAQQAAENAYNVFHLAALEADYGDLTTKAPSLITRSIIEVKKEHPGLSSAEVMAKVREKLDVVSKARKQVETGRVDITQRGRYANPVNGGRGAARPQGGESPKPVTPQDRAREVIADMMRT